MNTTTEQTVSTLRLTEVREAAARCLAHTDVTGADFAARVRSSGTPAAERLAYEALYDLLPADSEDDPAYSSEIPTLAPLLADMVQA